MKLGQLLALLLILVVTFWLGSLWSLSKTPVKKEIMEVVQEPQVAPYWTMYGQPTYWPFYLSPYWYYGVPYTGPIQNPTRGYRRDLYRPHGPRPGYTGVSTGGAGGGHGGGGHK